jgi:hypothetical protein
MKKILLLLSLAFFVGTAFVTVTKVQNVNAASTELAFLNDDEPVKTAKDAKCASAKSCDKTKCASKTEAAVKSGCCDSKKAKTMSGEKAAGAKTECCSKAKADTDKDKK